MAAYVIANIEIKDPTTYQEYSKQVPATLEKYGGKFVVRGGKLEKLEGEWEPKRIVVLEFENVEQAQRWYNSSEYQAIVGIRQQASTGGLILVEGY